MSEAKESQLLQVLSEYCDPHTQLSLSETKSIKRIQVSEKQIKVDLIFGYPIEQGKQALQKELANVIAPHSEGRAIEINIDWSVSAHNVQANLKALNNVKNIIAVASGKGGVGKSTTTINLALAMAREGARVGVLDADIYGPSLPRMIGKNEKPTPKDNKMLEPVMNYGLQSMSIGYLIDESAPMVWRGPMVSGALQQLLSETDWQDLDYLFIDMPPGTGDIHLTLVQKIPVTGAVIVTTPQDIALLDARKGLEMFNKVNVTVLGVIENMSTHICTQCGHEEAIFGHGGGEALAKSTGVDLLGQIPLDMSIREQADSGQPTLVKEPDGLIAERYLNIVRKLGAKLSLQSKDYSSKFPKIVIENS